MRLDKGFIHLRSWGGAVCSIILFTLIGLYTLQKFDVLLNSRDVNLITTTTFNAVTNTETFDSSTGFNIAVAFSAYDSETEPIDDPTVGELIFNHYKWGANPDGSIFAGRYKLKSHRCTP